MKTLRLAALIALTWAGLDVPPCAAESLWIEAEHLDGIRGYCWPMGRPDAKKTAGHWGLSGPGWAAEWNMGGESGFLSIAAGADDDRAVASKSIEIPSDGRYFVWVRYGDWREKTERFQVQIEQPAVGQVANLPYNRQVSNLPYNRQVSNLPYNRQVSNLPHSGQVSNLSYNRQVANLPHLSLGAGWQPAPPPQPAPWIGKYGDRAMVEEDNEMKLYWGWVFVWDQRPATLKKGPAKLSLMSTSKEPVPRQVDAIVLTTDPAYRPQIKERPRHPTWDVLAGYRRTMPTDLKPLAKNRPAWELPAQWRLHTFRDKGFLYLWNTSPEKPQETWLGQRPDRVKFPYHVADDETRKQFEKKYGGRDDVPIFSDPRIVPAFHGFGGSVFAADAKTGELGEAGRCVARWLDEHPGRAWAMMMNYHGGTPVGEKGIAAFTKYRDRYVGSIAGESLGYFEVDGAAMEKAVAGVQTRRQLVEAFSPFMLRANAEKYRKVFGRDLDKNAYEDVIPCLSQGNIAFAPLCSLWGARTIGYESTASTSAVLGMRWAFLRGAARQNGCLTATYRSCNFGDASTIFSNAGSFHSPQAILDNYYSVYSGAGMTWYKMDIWYQYMAGASMFYHEQGFDEFWRPGGTAAAGVQEVQLSPKGKLVDRFLRVTAAEPDRGYPFTPVAFLVDYAHGWEPAPFWPNAFGDYHRQTDRFRPGDHERMLEEYFWTAYYPIGPESEKPITGTNEVYLPGVFGDVFDVVYAYPDVTRWRTIDTYPVVIAAGEIELTAAEGERLAAYVASGGTLAVADGHLTGPGVAALRLPATGPQTEGSVYCWLGEAEIHPSQRFRFRSIPTKGVDVLATTTDGRCFCAAMDRGRGRLIYLSVPHGLGIDRRAVPVVPRLVAHLTRGLMPVEVEGDVEWLVNRTAKGWAVTLLNPAGQSKPQQGITPTDFRQNRTVTIRSRVPIQAARDRLLPEERLEVRQNAVRLEVFAGGVRVVEMQ